MKIEFSREILEIYSNIKFHENLSSRSGVVPGGRTEGPTDGETDHEKTNSRFSQF